MSSARCDHGFHSTSCTNYSQAQHRHWKRAVSSTRHAFAELPTCISNLIWFATDAERQYVRRKLSAGWPTPRLVVGLDSTRTRLYGRFRVSGCLHTVPLCRAYDRCGGGQSTNVVKPNSRKEITPIHASLNTVGFRTYSIH